MPKVSPQCRCKDELLPGSRFTTALLAQIDLRFICGNNNNHLLSGLATRRGAVSRPIESTKQHSSSNHEVHQQACRRPPSLISHASPAKSWPLSSERRPPASPSSTSAVTTTSEATSSAARTSRHQRTTTECQSWPARCGIRTPSSFIAHCLSSGDLRVHCGI